MPIYNTEFKPNPSMPSHRFNCLLQLRHLYLPASPPLTLQLTLITPNEHLQTPPISFTPPSTPLHQIFAFSLLLRHSKPQSQYLYSDQYIIIRLVGRKGKEAFDVGQGRLNIAQLANKNNRMYENEFEVRVGEEARVTMQVRVRREEREGMVKWDSGEVAAGGGRNSTVLGASRNRVMVDRGFSDMSEMSENSVRSSKTFENERGDNMRHSTPTSTQPRIDIEQQNQLLRRKLEELYNKIGKKEQDQSDPLSQHEAISPQKIQQPHSLPHPPTLPQTIAYQPIVEDKYQFDIELVLQEKKKIEMKLSQLKKEYDSLLEKYTTSEKARRELLALSHERTPSSGQSPTK